MLKLRLSIRVPHFPRIREYLKFSLPIVPGTMAQWAVASSDRYVISFFLGPTSVGVYSVGYSIGSFPMMATFVISFALLPTISKLYDESETSKVKTYLSYSLKYLLALFIPFVFGAAILSEPVLRLFSTAEIASQARFIVPLVALGILFHGSCAVVAHILALVKKTKTNETPQV